MKMELRKELQPSKKITEYLVKKLVKISKSIEDTWPPENYEELVADFNSIAGTNLIHRDFQGISGGLGHRQWVYTHLSIDHITPVYNITYLELVEICRRAKYSSQSKEWEQTFYKELLDRYIPGADIWRLIHYPYKWFNGECQDSWPKSAEEIVDWALTTQDKMPLGFPQGKKLPELPASKLKQAPAIIYL